jgi:hypothetical protein
MTAAMIGRVLAKTHTSGSLAYHGQCQAGGGTWDLPIVRFPKHHELNPVQMLGEMFADNPEMHVTQDANGYIRMVETDVPRDLLDLRIVQVSFPSGAINNANIAVTQIMVTPDVKNYMTVNNIGPVSDSYRFIVLSSPDAPQISGNLYFATVSEALDYILKIYPGFWAYEECKGEAGGRKVFFHFFPTVSEEVAPMMLKLESQRPEKIYGTSIGSSYQHQALMLSKQFRKG